MSDRSNPPIFDAASIEASRDGESVLIEIRTAGHIRMVFRVEPQAALGIAHQLEKAFHQRTE